jgi:hypothetical protein
VSIEHCTGRGELVHHGGTVWTVDVAHDDACPVLTGTVSRAEATRQAAAHIGRPVLYVRVNLL